MEKFKYCKICGNKFGRIKLGMCAKHYTQFKKYGKVLDSNPRTVWDDNEIRILNGYGEIDTYTNTGEVQNTFKFDLEDLKYLSGKKWRSVFKGQTNSAYLVTGHTIYFHRLIMGNPKSEIDHINRDSTDNRKFNLRESFRTQQLANTNVRLDNVQGIKGVCFLSREKRYRAEIQIHNRRFQSQCFKKQEEAVYMRYLLEQVFYSKIGIHNNVQKIKNLIQSIPPIRKIQLQEDCANLIQSKMVDYQVN